MLIWARDAKAIDEKQKKLVDNMIRRLFHMSDLRTALKVKVFKDQGDEAVDLMERMLVQVKKKYVMTDDHELIDEVEEFVLSIKQHRKGGLKAVE